MTSSAPRSTRSSPAPSPASIPAAAPCILRIGSGTEATEALLGANEQVPGEELTRGQLRKGLCGGGPPRHPGPPGADVPDPSRAWSSACLSWRCPEIYDGTVEIQLHRPGGRQPHQDGRVVLRRERGPHRRLRGPQGPAGGRRGGGAAGREDRHHQVLRRPRRVHRRRPVSRRRGGACSLPDEGKACRVIVPDDQLSLAIGKEGQNARLAAQLTGLQDRHQAAPP